MSALLRPDLRGYAESYESQGLSKYMSSRESKNIQEGTKLDILCSDGKNYHAQLNQDGILHFKNWPTKWDYKGPLDLLYIAKEGTFSKGISPHNRYITDQSQKSHLKEASSWIKQEKQGSQHKENIKRYADGDLDKPRNLSTRSRSQPIENFSYADLSSRRAKQISDKGAVSPHYSNKQENTTKPQVVTPRKRATFANFTHADLSGSQAKKAADKGAGSPHYSEKQEDSTKPQVVSLYLVSPQKKASLSNDIKIPIEQESEEIRLLSDLLQTHRSCIYGLLHTVVLYATLHTFSEEKHIHLRAIRDELTCQHQEGNGFGRSKGDIQKNAQQTKSILVGHLQEYLTKVKTLGGAIFDRIDHYTWERKDTQTGGKLVPQLKTVNQFESFLRQMLEIVE